MCCSDQKPVHPSEQRSCSYYVTGIVPSYKHATGCWYIHPSRECPWPGICSFAHALHIRTQGQRRQFRCKGSYRDMYLCSHTHTHPADKCMHIYCTDTVQAHTCNTHRRTVLRGSCLQRLHSTDIVHICPHDISDWWMFTAQHTSRCSYTSDRKRTRRGQRVYLPLFTDVLYSLSVCHSSVRMTCSHVVS